MLLCMGILSLYLVREVKYTATAKSVSREDGEEVGGFSVKHRPRTEPCENSESL